MGARACATSALSLLAAAAWLAIDALLSLRTPRIIAYEEALMVGMLGLVVNLACAWVLAVSASPAEGHDHAHDPAHAARGHIHHHHDHNFRAAYMHVVADVLTSVLALIALAGGLWWGWPWLDAAAALVALR
jgi:Co/Zn/Cd efflux system component